MGFTEFNNIPDLLIIIKKKTTFDTVSWELYIQNGIIPSILILKEAAEKEIQYLHI